MKAQNTINLGQISGEMKTWNTFILGSKGLTEFVCYKVQMNTCDILYSSSLCFVQPVRKIYAFVRLHG